MVHTFSPFCGEPASGMNAAIKWHDNTQGNTNGFFTLYVTDNGAANLSMDLADQVMSSKQDTSCDDAQAGTNAVLRWNIVVNDATP
jgi:hypothetical protein